MSSDLDEAVKLGLSPSPTLFSSLLATFRQTLPMQCRTAPSSSRLTPVQRELLSPRRFLTYWVYIISFLGLVSESGQIKGKNVVL